MSSVNMEGVEEVKQALERGEPLNFRHCYQVFGPEFYELVLYTVMDAQEAARAIQSAMLKFSGGAKVKVGRKH